MKKPKEHKITTMKQLFDVANKNNYNDLMRALSITIECFIELKNKYPDIQNEYFNWIDDGKNNIDFKFITK